MRFEQIRTSGDRTFSYLLACEEAGEAAIVDPGYDPDRLLGRVRELDLDLKYVINSHGHHDHTGGNAYLLQSTDARLAAFRSGDVPLEDGSTLTLGTLTLSIIHTPGHTEDGICILVGNTLLTGDTLFVGKVGGTDFEEGARQEYDSLHGKIMVLDDAVRIYPGHDYGVRTQSTIGAEREENPFLLQEDFESFVHLKVNWEAYKREHGIA